MEGSGPDAPTFRAERLVGGRLRQRRRSVCTARAGARRRPAPEHPRARTARPRPACFPRRGPARRDWQLRHLRRNPPALISPRAVLSPKIRTGRWDMYRVLFSGLLLIAFAGCQLPAERVPLRPLPDEAGPIPYAELLTRARVQAMNAQEMYYLDKWQDLEEAAKGLEQTAKHLPKASEVPVNQKDTLPVTAGDLGKEAVKL